MKKRFFILPIIFALLFCASCSSTGDNNVNAGKPVQLKVTGTALTDMNGELVQLRGVSFGWHHWWPRFYNPTTVKWLKHDWKVNVVRAAIGVEPAGAILDNPELAMVCLYSVVDAAIDNDLYVIIDWHAHHIHTEAAKAFFTEVAGKYKDYPNIIYEIFNEPDYQPWEEVKQYSKEVIAAIRAIDKKNIILVGVPHWCQDVHIVADDPITGFDNLMYTLHFYAATHKDFLRSRADYALSKGLPLFVSECAGMTHTGDGPIDRVSWGEWVKWMDDNKLSWLAWSLSDKAESCSMIKIPESPISNWTDDDLKEWGIIVRDELQKKQ